MNLILAVDENWAIWNDGEQLIYISEDLKRFKSLTYGHSVILGRKTLSTFPKGQPLKGRRNLILSRNSEFKVADAEVFSDMEKLLAVAPEDSFVIGGASVYAALVNHCNTAYVTKIEKSFCEADCWFPNLDLRPDWYVAEEGPRHKENRITFRYMTYRRKL